ncbi:hypothetical protein [Nocardia sp. CDC160]|uniref:hypothetical protein n=1 Tax=Nocardia sp. CDC160 TaxID=3112166 RepID=UPI002DBB9D78|nr:hypothetical protein [Nocardia sp. CDC160]MEC3919172.1 hypothetical protein [Nocardia sp. CDC160]
MADPPVLPGGVLMEVLAARVPFYTRQVLTGELGYDLLAPLIPGPTCIGRAIALAEDVFGFEITSAARRYWPPSDNWTLGSDTAAELYGLDYTVLTPNQ